MDSHSLPVESVDEFDSFSYLNVDHDPKFNRREPNLFQSAVVYDYIAFLASEMMECFRFSLRNTLAAHRSKKHC